MKAIEETGQADDTLVFFIAGDNGASVEGGEHGMRTQFSHLIDVAPTILEAVADACGNAGPVSGGSTEAPCTAPRWPVPRARQRSHCRSSGPHGGRFGGWSLSVEDGRPGYTYNFLGLQRSDVTSTTQLKPGKSTIRFEFAYDGGGMGKGGTGTLYLNDEKIGEGRIEHTQGMVFSADETADVGIDLGTPVVESIGAEAASRFNGHIPKVTIAIR